MTLQDPNIDPTNIRNKDNNAPYIIYINSNKEKKFYIDIFDQLLSVSLKTKFFKKLSHKSDLFFFYFKVPTNFDFIAVLDMFVKIHKMLQIQFHGHLQQVMCSFCAHIYKFDDDQKHLTPKSLAQKHIFNPELM